MKGGGISRKCETIRCNEKRDAADVEDMDGELHEGKKSRGRQRGRREVLRKISRTECDEASGEESEDGGSGERSGEKL